MMATSFLSLRASAPRPMTAGRATAAPPNRAVAYGICHRVANASTATPLSALRTARTTIASGTQGGGLGLSHRAPSSAPRRGRGRGGSAVVKTMAAKSSSGAGSGADAGAAAAKAQLSGPTPMGPNTTSAEAVNNGLACFEKRRYADAVANFTAALSNFGAPSEDESRAALYNRACAHVKLQQYDEAKADLTAAVNEYALKFSVVLKDPDMEVFRGTAQYEEMEEEEVKGFRSNKAIASLRAEAQEPFRFLKLYVFGGLAAGATLGLIIILTRLAAALQGGDDAPDLGETLTNMAVNLGGIGVFGYLLKGEFAARDRMKAKVEREEEMGRLRVCIAENSEDVLMSQLRGNYRVFVIAGSEGHIEDTVTSLAKYKAMLKENNVIIATLDMKTGVKGVRKGGGKVGAGVNPGAGVAALAAEFAAARTGNAGGEDEAAAPEIQFGNRSRRAEVAVAASSVTERRWRVAPVDEVQWRAWVISEVERSGFDPEARDVFFSVGKDGTMWKSGAGIPNWMNLIEELPSKSTVGV
mmetsp:Transcript_2319/g.3647  ORF Transcript_2319/g.3647 Transcript_2319/m.3647 type:complete len:527 (+) Transcript_2319:163-1743(+)